MMPPMKLQGRTQRFCLCASLVLVLLCTFGAAAQEASANASAKLTYGSLNELIGKRHVLLIIKRAAIVDAQGGHTALIEDALKSDPRQSRRYRNTYNTIAEKLNKFMRKYKSMSAVGRVEEAEYVIFFNLLEYRRPLGTPYPYGELFVILKPTEGAHTAPRVLWKSQKVKWAADAVDDLIDELKLIRWENSKQ